MEQERYYDYMLRNMREEDNKIIPVLHLYCNSRSERAGPLATVA